MFIRVIEVLEQIGTRQFATLGEDDPTLPTQPFNQASHLSQHAQAVTLDAHLQFLCRPFFLVILMSFDEHDWMRDLNLNPEQTSH